MSQPRVDHQNTPLQIECAQVYGGNQATRMEVSLPGLDGYLYSQPCQALEGGDIHFLSICDSGVLSRFCLADVVGHGADVAIVSNAIHALLRKSINWTDHRRILRQLNSALAVNGPDSMTTAALFSYFPPTRHLTFSYAGHPPAWRYSVADRDWAPLQFKKSKSRARRVSDIPLAVADEVVYSRGRVRVSSGDLIIVTTDGVSDALNASAHRFGETGIEEALRSVAHPTPRLVVDRIKERLLEFCQVERFRHDDVTILALRTTPVSPLSALGSMLANRIADPLKKRLATDPY